MNRPVRRNVVILFIDIVGSTELAERLDPELLLRILERYYDVCRSEISARGGVVEKYIGDAIMAVFGVPIGREDDALRAAGAACAAMTAVHRLSEDGVRLDAHCGIAFGQVMVVDRAGADVRVIGDAVNTASRLQSAAGAGEILLGDDVARLIRGRAVLGEIPPLTLKGKREPVRAWRLIAMEHGEPETDTTPLVGRDAELHRLTRLHEQVVAERRCGMATLLGVPGIGKSRLVREFLATLPAEVTVLTGRCPSYGLGATYRPIAEILDSLPDDGADLVGPPLRGLSSFGDSPGVSEIALAVRSLFETLARRQPLVVVFEDLQWAEPTLLDLIEDCAKWLPDVPVLILCLARPELCDSRPSWSGTVVELGPLGPQDMARLVAELCASRAEVIAHDDGAYHRVTHGSDGNPLFAELMLETLAEGADSLPPTIQALLGARLDRLATPERDTLERAATIGQTFTAGQVDALCDAEPRATATTLTRLQHGRLIRRGARPDSYEFTQTLTRETVYTLTSKELRADWHRTLASAADSTLGDVSRHLVAACRLTMEVRPGDPILHALTDRAAASLIRDGSQALHRKDLPAAIALLEQGREILPPGRAEHRTLAVRISDAELARGDAAAARTALARAEELLPGDRRNQLTCAIQRRIVSRTGTPEDLASFRARLADDLSWCRFHQLEALIHTEAGRFAPADLALRSGLARARVMDDRYEEDRLLGGLCELVQWSLTPVEEGLALCADLLARFAGDRALLVPVLVTRARLLGLAGDLPAARAALDTADAYARELRLDLPAIAAVQVRGLVEAMAGHHEQARSLFTHAAAALRAAGYDTPAVTLEIYAAREALRQGDVRQAATDLAHATARPRLQFRGELAAIMTGAAIASHGGEHEQALLAATRAVTLLDSTDDPCLRGDILFEVAQIHRAARGNPADLARRALEAYLSKGASLPARKVGDWIGDTCP
ncbi:AAA family ATPase [Nonomuraea typhae]|uniref:AAA family ATPase n=1 Tax=Nonomuraea typhae TaxID=2603600 RepID=A0ABW7Z2K0_9ACTN